MKKILIGSLALGLSCSLGSSLDESMINSNKYSLSSIPFSKINQGSLIGEMPFDIIKEEENFYNRKTNSLSNSNSLYIMPEKNLIKNQIPPYFNKRRNMVRGNKSN